MDDLLIRLMEPIESAGVINVWRRSRWDALRWLEERMNHSPEDDAAFFEHTVARENQVWIADCGGLIVGMMALSDSVISHLFIDPDWQGRGVGSALLDRAKELFPYGLSLFTHQRNTRAQDFYERHGFVVTRRGISPPPESEPDLLYEYRPAHAEPGDDRG
ncbi:MAG: GNAT family N-acetyltransferase [bacterium]|nr:GNAT family N-acetyltransferase [bacterium]